MDEIVSVKERVLGGKNCSSKDIDMACSKDIARKSLQRESPEFYNQDSFFLLPPFI